MPVHLDERSSSKGNLLLFPVPGGKESALLWLTVVALGCANIAATWGHVGFVWGDMGVWLHEVERFARGEIPYRDFYWPYPPATIWLMGLVGKVFGTHAAVFWATTAAIFLCMLYLFSRYAGKLLPSALVLPLAVSAVLFATAQESRLAMGMYTPAALLGFLFLLGAVLATVKLFSGGGWPHAAGVGALCALMILSKHDYWIPALYLMTASTVLLWKSGAATRVTLAATVTGTFLLTLGVAVLVIYGSASWEAVLQIPGGAGQFTTNRGRGSPSGERLTLEMIVLSLLALFTLSILALGRLLPIQKFLRRASGLAGIAILGAALFLQMNSGPVGGSALQASSSGYSSTLAEAQPPTTEQNSELRSIAIHLKRGLMNRTLPFFLPIAVLGLVFLRRKELAAGPRVLAILLLGLCITARSRRLFEYTEWFHFLLELPVYAFVFLLFQPITTTRMKQAVVAGLAVLLLFAAYFYWNRGVGFLTRRGRFVEQETTKGTVYLEPEHVAAFRKLQSTLSREDPSGQLPLFALGHSGGFNYFLDRENPTPLTLGFWLSSFSAEEIVTRLASNPLPMFLLEN